MPKLREKLLYRCEHFHTYLYGRTFELETDHRPLEYLFQPKVRPAGKPPPSRIECWILRLQEYDRYTCNLVQQMTPCAMETEEIRQASLVDKEIKQVRNVLETNQLQLLPKAFQNISSELSVTDNILLRGNRIVQAKAVLLSNEDHTGITRTKQRLRSTLW